MHLPQGTKGPPPAPMGGPAAGGQDHLARKIGEVCKNLPGVLPMQCYSLANPARRLPSGRELLHNGAPPPAVTQVMAERLLSALASLRNASNAAAQVAQRITIRQFRGYSEPQQISFINDLWNAISTSHAFNQAPAAMFDPAGDDLGGNGPLPSSICPVGIGASTFRKRLSGKQPFRELGIGFRVDGSDENAINRITGEGMTQQRLSSAFMLSRRGLRLDGTVMADDSTARIWTGNHDIFNESAVCVSRNFFGGTAFPERETNGTCYLWAVNCANLLGFDTEDHQVGLPNSRQWRPGEKAFHFIPPGCALAHVKIDRRGAPATGGWKFDVPRDANWTYTGSPSVKQRAYIEDELAAWRGGSYTIPAAFDFAT